MVKITAICYLSCHHGNTRKVVEAMAGAGGADLIDETALLEATIGLHRRYGKNAVVKGMDLLEAGTTRERNNQIGGHRK